MPLPRIAHRLYAFFSGYFWSDCPICGRMYGGHETNESLMTSLTGGICVCPKCSNEARRRNRQYTKTHLVLYEDWHGKPLDTAAEKAYNSTDAQTGVRED